MKAKKQTAGKLPWGTIFGFSLISVYVSFTVIAVVLFKGRVSLLTTYLSMLGNAEISPTGAIFYNLAVILGGLIEILFFLAIFAYYSPYGNRWLMRIGLLAGIINGLSVLMSGVYAEHINMEAHVFWSYMIFFSFIPVLLAHNLVLWSIAKWVSLYGFIVCAIDIFLLVTILSGGLDPGLGSIMEWVSVFTYLAWVALISLDVLQGPRAGVGVDPAAGQENQG